jgi:polyribonucleotide nucleotidyltransferase
VYCKVQQGADDVKKEIQALVEEPEVGKIYQGKVKRITDFGAFIEFLPGKEGLCHISNMSHQRIRSVRDVLTEDQIIPVKLIEIDKLGRASLSYIAAISDSDETESGHGTHRRPRHERYNKRR